MILLALTLTLCLGTAAFAENAAEEPAAPETTESVVSEETADSTEAAAKALEDAMNAFKTARRSARNQKRMDEMKTELDSYVQAGTLTQEQADLILGYMADQQSQREAARTERQKMIEEGKSCHGMGRNGNGGRYQRDAGNFGNNGRNGRGNNGRNGRGGSGRNGHGNRMFNSFPMGYADPAMQQGTGI